MKVNIQIDNITHGNNYIVEGNDEDIINAIRKEIDINVRKIIIKKSAVTKCVQGRKNI